MKNFNAGPQKGSSETPEEIRKRILSIKNEKIDLARERLDTEDEIAKIETQIKSAKALAEAKNNIEEPELAPTPPEKQKTTKQDAKPVEPYQPIDWEKRKNDRDEREKKFLEDAAAYDKKTKEWFRGIVAAVKKLVNGPENGNEKMFGLEIKAREIDAKIQEYVKRFGKDAKQEYVDVLEKEIDDIVVAMIQVAKKYNVNVAYSTINRKKVIVDQPVVPQSPVVETAKRDHIPSVVVKKTPTPQAPSKEVAVVNPVQTETKAGTQKQRLEARLANAKKLGLSPEDIQLLQNKINQLNTVTAQPPVSKAPTQGSPEEYYAENPVNDRTREPANLAEHANNFGYSTQENALSPENSHNNTNINPGQNSRAPGQTPPNPGNPGNPNQNPQDNISDPKVDYANFLNICKQKGTENLAKQVNSLVPGFSTLPEGQKMLVLQGMNDALLNHVNQVAVENFQKKLTPMKITKLGKFFGMKDNGQGNAFSKFFNVIGNAPAIAKNLPLLIRKTYLTSKFRKQELQSLTTEDGPENAVKRMKFINENVPGLMKVFGESGVGAYLGPDGKVITDFSNRAALENASPQLKQSANQYNLLANKLAHTPHEDKKAYALAEQEFTRARNAFLLGLKEKAERENIPNPKFEASLFVEKSEILMRTMSFLAADQNTAGRLDEIAHDKVFVQAFKDIWAQRGVSMVGGSAARYGAKAYFASLGLIAVAGGPLSWAVIGTGVLASAPIAAVFGYYRGKKRAEQSLDEKDKLARRGAKQKGETAIGMGNVERHLARLVGPINPNDRLGTTGLIAQLQNEVSPMKRQEILSRIKTVHDFIEAKLERREINFGKNEQQIFVNQNKLMNALHKAQTAMQVELHEPEIMNIFDPKASGAELGFDSRTRQYVKMQGIRNVKRNEQARENFKESQAKKSAFYGALAATTGVALTEFAHHVEWPMPDWAKHGQPAPTSPSVNHNGIPSPMWGVDQNNQDPFWNWLNNPSGPVPGNPANGGGVANHIPSPHHIYHPKVETKTDDDTDVDDIKINDENMQKQLIDNPEPKITGFDKDHPKMEFAPIVKTPEIPQVPDPAVINQMAEDRMLDDLKRFFPEGRHARLLNRDADKFLSRDEGAISNPGKEQLHEYFVKYEDITGDAPHEGETVGDFLKRVDYYYAEQDYAQGRNLPQVFGDVQESFKEGYPRYHKKVVEHALGLDENSADAQSSNAPIDPINNKTPFSSDPINSSHRPQGNNPMSSLLQPKNPLAGDKAAMDWHRDSLNEYFKGTDQERRDAWSQIRGTKARSFLDSQPQSEASRALHDDLLKVMRKERIRIGSKTTVEELMNSLAKKNEHRALLHELVTKELPARPVNHFLTSDEISLRQGMQFSPDAQRWYRSSIFEYFGRDIKPWRQIENLKARDFFENNLGPSGYEVDSFRNALRADYFKNFGSNSSQYANMTVRDVMERLALSGDHLRL